MRKIIVGAMVSMDGVMQAPGEPPAVRQPLARALYNGWPEPRAAAAFYTGRPESDGCGAPNLGRQAGRNRRKYPQHNTEV
jgi:hypothetical protein